MRRVTVVDARGHSRTELVSDEPPRWAFVTFLILWTLGWGVASAYWFPVSAPVKWSRECYTFCSPSP